MTRDDISGRAEGITPGNCISGLHIWSPYMLVGSLPLKREVRMGSRGAQTTRQAGKFAETLICTADSILWKSVYRIDHRCKRVRRTRGTELAGPSDDR